MRDELLEQQTELEWLFACMEEVMLQECPQYKETKSRSPASRDEEAKQWARFVNVAKSGAERRKECLAPITKASGLWGRDKALHYEWGFMGWKYSKKLGTAATRNAIWEEAVVKLNQLLLTRITNGEPLGLSTNPVTQTDLENLGAWRKTCDYTKTGRNGFTLPYQPLCRSTLPEGYTFDQYGLIISTEVAHPPKSAAVTQSSIRSEAPSPPLGDGVAASSPPASHGSSPATSPESSHPNRSVASSPLSPLGTTPPADDITPSSTPEARETTTSKTYRADVIPVPSAGRKSDRLRAAKSYKEPPLRGCATSSPAKTKKRGQPSDTWDSRPCTCATTVAPELLSTIDCDQPTTAEDVKIAVQYAAQRRLLCKKHLEQYASWATNGMMCAPSPSHDQTIKRRRISLPELGTSFGQAAAKRVSRNEPIAASIQGPVANIGRGRPVHDTTGDAVFREQVLAHLAHNVVRRAAKTWGEQNNIVMYDLLSRARQPVTSGRDDEIEAYFLTGEEAEGRLDSNSVLHGPIVTENQQQLKWDLRKGKPLVQLFRRLVNLNRSVSVQKPSRSLEISSFVQMQLSDVRNKFQENVSKDPLNVLEMGSPLPRSILPSFLTGEDCQLLGRVRDAVLNGDSGERPAASITEWSQWKDVEDWVLLAQGGAQTLLHQDSCGKATWLTVQQGRVGFGWISRPSEEVLRSWSADPINYTGEKLRYVVLSPGQTIYFEAGTIHFVFRPVQDPTFLLGGHIMRWSRVDSMMEIVLNQLRFPDTTNEDLLPSAKVYVETVIALVSDLQRQGSIEELGGEKAVARFSQLKEVLSPAIRRRK
jgi:hypothetical protein